MTDDFASRPSGWFLSLDCDGLGAQAQVWRNDGDTKTLLAAVGHETRDGGTVTSAFGAFDEGEPLSDICPTIHGASLAALEEGR